MASGLDLNTPLAKAFAIDDAIEAYLNIAFDEKMGYLTACPTNLGTGLRASVLLHLPALVMTQQLSKNCQHFTTIRLSYPQFLWRR